MQSHERVGEEFEIGVLVEVKHAAVLEENFDTADIGTQAVAREQRNIFRGALLQAVPLKVRSPVNHRHMARDVGRKIHVRDFLIFLVGWHSGANGLSVQARKDEQAKRQGGCRSQNKGAGRPTKWGHNAPAG